ncbi:hypothetical protein [Desertibacillus haloalkaliphilus]|uniref:hypothetical protein n=1 Tax=Desertibacillus haloalkaliphilus TaxID=1328930 RepID=UPI001C27FAA2|nr:hypothetical protein [Desertibacillus haloalkaliphilus]MBU8908869.1 hypothetical protein [Desertibacillus haloalkaliphilus]
MEQSLQIFIEYKVKPTKVKEYEEVMEKVVDLLPEFEASDIQWFIATDQPYLYVEMFKVPTKSHYLALKKLRQSDEHHLFSQIGPMVEGGLKSIHCWAFQAKVNRS